MSKTANPTRVTTGKARLSYANIWEPRANDEGKEQYSVAILIPKSDKATIGRIQEAQEEALRQGKAKYGAAWKPSMGKIALHDGDEKDDEVYAGHYYVNARNTKRPYIYDRFRNPIDDRTEVYSGCYAEVGFDVFPYQHKASNAKGISASLIAIRKVADGESLGGGVSESEAQDMFEPLTETDDDLGM